MKFIEKKLLIYLTIINTITLLGILFCISIGTYVYITQKHNIQDFKHKYNHLYYRIISLIDTLEAGYTKIEQYFPILDKINSTLSTTFKSPLIIK